MLSNSHLFIGLPAVTGNSYFHLLFYPSFFPSVRRFSWNKPINFFFQKLSMVLGAHVGQFLGETSLGQK